MGKIEEDLIEGIIMVDQITLDNLRKCCIFNTMESGHTMNTCFKIHGYLDWYKELKQNKNNTRIHANIVNTKMEKSLDCGGDYISIYENIGPATPQQCFDLITLKQASIRPSQVPSRNFAQTHF